MTDGAGSHRGLSVEELVTTRRAEAVAAAAILGVSEDCLHFLGHPDGALAQHEGEARNELGALLDALAPSQVVAPHPFEPQPDHRASFRIAERAAHDRATPLDALLYAVWFWDQWPWTNPLAPPHPRHSRRDMFDVAWRGGLGSRLGRLLPLTIDIRDAVDRKRTALAAHVSQTERPPDRPDWLTLADVADGDWLDLLLQPFESYRPMQLGTERGI